MEHNRQIAALPDFEGIVCGSNILPCQLVQPCRSIKLCRRPLSSRSAHRQGRTGNIIKVEAVIHIPSAVVFNEEVLYNGHSRLKDKFVFLNNGFAVVEIYFYLASVEQIILDGNGSIHKSKGGDAKTNGKER